MTKQIKKSLRMTLVLATAGVFLFQQVAYAFPSQMSFSSTPASPVSLSPSHKIFFNSPSQLAAGVATWGVLEAAEKIDAGPLGEAGLLLLGTSLANAAVQVATSDQLQAKDFGNVLGGEIKESVQNIVKSTLSLGTNVDRNTPYGETVYQQKIAEVAKKVKEEGLGETLEQSLTNAMQNQAIGQATQMIQGTLTRVMIGDKPGAQQKIKSKDGQVTYGVKSGHWTNWLRLC